MSRPCPGQLLQASVCASFSCFSQVQVGWKHEKAVAMLEDKRKVKAQKYYEQKKKLIALRNKAEQQVKVAA